MEGFKAIINELKKAQKQIEVDLERMDDMPDTSKTFILGRISTAKINIQSLVEKYRQQANQDAIVFMPYGESVEEFARIASEEFGCYAIDLDGFYEKISESIDKSYYDNKSVSNMLFTIITSNIIEQALEMGVIDIDAPVFNSKYSRMLNNKEDLLTLIRQIVNVEVSMELPLWYGMYSGVNKAIEAQFSGKNLPLILYSKDQELNKVLISKMTKVHPNTKAIEINSSQLDSEIVKKTLLEARKKKK